MAYIVQLKMPNPPPPPKKKDKIMEINGNSNIDRMGGSIRPHKKNPKQSKFPKKMKITGGTPIEISKQSKFQKKIMKIRGGTPSRGLRASAASDLQVTCRS